MDVDRDALTEAIIGAAIEVHREMGPGLLESVYQVCIERELTRRNVAFLRQYPVPLVYKGESLGALCVSVVSTCSFLTIVGIDK